MNRIFGSGSTCRTFCAAVTLWLLLVTAATAEQVAGSSAAGSGSGHERLRPGESEKRIEQLQLNYQLFPLNPAYKRKLAEEYASIGHTLLKQKRFDKADESFAKAIELYPDEGEYALLRGVCNYQWKKYDIARYELDRAKTLKPESVEALVYLGLVQFDTDNHDQAIELWEQALKLAPERKEIIELLAKGRKENGVESSMDRGHSSRFDLTYDPGVDTAFSLAVLDVLESAANQVGGELGLFPEARVPVGIYKRTDYKTVTNSPDWSGGVYDGKIRLPFGALKEISPELRSVLYHEYAHVVVFELTHGNCPLWLNEGIAEMFGRMQFSRPLIELEHAARKDALLDFRKLEGSFSKLSAADAALAYQQSYGMVNYMVSTFGWHQIKQILTGLGSGLTIDQAVVAALRDYNQTYDSLVNEWRASVLLKK